MRHRHVRLAAALALLLIPLLDVSRGTSSQQTNEVSRWPVKTSTPRGTRGNQTLLSEAEPSYWSVGGGASLLAQGRRGASSFRQAVPYDGNLVFTRLIYGSGLGGFGFGGAAWSHDYPAADKNMGAILDYISHARVRLDGTNVLDLDDPEIFQNPILYVWEPGYWAIEASEAARLREYLLKGGFVIFDDFEGPGHWENMTRQMKRALPDHDFIKIDETHSIFHSFYNINKLDVPHPSMSVVPGYWAMYENNDPGGRMIALANHNNDIAEYWEWSAEGLYSQDRTGDAYRLGVNYYIYAMTH